MTTAEQLDLAERVGKELVRLGLSKHVEHLRTYYRHVRAGRPPPNGGWTEGLVIEWAKTLRLRPYEDAYPVKARSSSCGCSSPQTYTKTVWPDGSVHTCGSCKLVWVELDRA